MSPVYFSAYASTWNPEPLPIEGEFEIDTRWVGDMEIMEGGKSYTLEVSIKVKKDADYVMIKIPIPAGCSYNTKDQFRNVNEVHREYDYHETRIFAERLKTGTYHYTIDLLARFKGKYTANPATAEWMYFPTIYGRDKIQMVVIK